MEDEEVAGNGSPVKPKMLVRPELLRRHRGHGLMAECWKYQNGVLNSYIRLSTQSQCFTVIKDQ